VVPDEHDAGAVETRQGEKDARVPLALTGTAQPADVGAGVAGKVTQADPTGLPGGLHSRPRIDSGRVAGAAGQRSGVWPVEEDGERGVHQPGELVGGRHGVDHALSVQVLRHLHTRRERPALELLIDLRPEKPTRAPGSATVMCPRDAHEASTPPVVGCRRCTRYVRPAARCESPAGDIIPTHSHNETHETFYVLDGKVRIFFQDGDGTKTSKLLTPGDFGYVPAGTPHAYRIEEAARMMGVLSGGFERFFQHMGTATDQATADQPPFIPDFPRMQAAAQQHNMQFMPDFQWPDA